MGEASAPTRLIFLRRGFPEPCMLVGNPLYFGSLQSWPRWRGSSPQEPTAEPQKRQLGSRERVPSTERAGAEAEAVMLAGGEGLCGVESCCGVMGEGAEGCQLGGGSGREGRTCESCSSKGNLCGDGTGRGPVKLSWVQCAVGTS